MGSNESKGPQEYDQLECPICKCPDVYIGGLGEEAVKKGQLPPNAVQFARVDQGMVPPKNVADRLPIGSSAYSYVIGYDVCMKCHTLYARKVSITSAVKVPRVILPDGLKRN